MSVSFAITADSTGDTHGLPEGTLDGVVPFHININNESFEDGVNITPSYIISVFDKTGDIPTTSAPSVSEYTDLFSSMLQTHEKVLHLSMASALSSGFNNAKKLPKASAAVLQFATQKAFQAESRC